MKFLTSVELMKINHINRSRPWTFLMI